MFMEYLCIIVFMIELMNYGIVNFCPSIVFGLSLTFLP